MDLVNAAVGLKQAQVTSQIQFAVARKLLDSQQAQGDAAVKLINAAAKIGTNASDEMAAAATGLGANLDAYG